MFCSVIENEYLLMKLLLDFSRDKDFIVKIGSELFEEGTEDLSLIASKYKIYGNSTGAIGVLGPKRMDYSRVIRNLNLFRRNLTRFSAPRHRCRKDVSQSWRRTITGKKYQNRLSFLS